MAFRGARVGEDLGVERSCYILKYENSSYNAV